MYEQAFAKMGTVLKTLYRDRVTIYGGKAVVRNGATEVQPVVIASNYPAKLSLKALQASVDGNYGTDAYDAKLILDNGVSVPAGAVIDVLDVNGRTTRYKRSSAGYTAYASHQEMAMVRDEKAKVSIDE
jgi:predicted secreted protein